MTDYETSLIEAWKHLLDWVKQGKLRPQNEEDIQCFLYHALVLKLGTAVGIHAKATTAKPEKLKFQNGKLKVGEMHFPDLALGEDREHPVVVVEIKFRPIGRKYFFDRCKEDIAKLKRLHADCTYYFVLFDQDPENVFMDEHQFSELKASLSSNGRILVFPETLSSSALKGSARKAIAKMRESGVDFSELGRKGAAKAVRGKLVGSETLTGQRRSR